jgi:uncharacterized membrane protein
MSKFIAISKLTIKFIVGSILGLLLAGLVYDNFAFSNPELNTIQIVVSSAFVIFCGIQSANSGCNFIGEILRSFFDIAAIGR